MSKIIMHIDLNAFFATAEGIKDPSVIGKPLIVAGSSRRGIVSTASYEARKYGIHSAMPTYQAKRLCKNLIVKPCDFELYSKLSHEFFDYIKTYTKIIEVASIDECYADMTECMKDVLNPEKYLKELQMDLYKKTKLKCSIGLAPTKFLAKMASDMKKPMGITIIRRKDIKKILWPVPIKDMYGVGKKTFPRLEKLGIYKIGDLAITEDPLVKKVLGKGYTTLKEWANGQGSDEVITDEWNPKSIGTTSTFLYDTNDFDEIKDLIYRQCKELTERLVKENKLAKTINITYKDSEFKSTNRSITLDVPVNKLDQIYDYAIKLFDKNYKGQLIRLAGVSLSNFIEKDQLYVQMSLFNIEENRKECETKLLINELNRKVDKTLFMSASELKKGDKNGNK